MKSSIRKIGWLEVGMFVVTVVALSKTVNTTNENTKFYASINFQNVLLSESITRGSEIYTDFCTQCHLPDGKGTPKVFPPLAGSDWLTSKRNESIHSIKYGLTGAIIVNGESYNGAMTPLGLENDEIADVMNYIMNSWGNTQQKMVTPTEVSLITK